MIHQIAATRIAVAPLLRGSAPDHSHRRVRTAARIRSICGWLVIQIRCRLSSWRIPHPGCAMLVTFCFLTTGEVVLPQSVLQPPRSDCLLIPDTPPNPDSVAFDTCLTSRRGRENFYVKRWFWLGNLRGITQYDYAYSDDSAEYDWRTVIDSTRPALVSALEALEAKLGPFVFSTSNGDAILDLRDIAYLRFKDYVHCDSTLRLLREALAIASDTAYVEYDTRFAPLAAAHPRFPDRHLAILTIGRRVAYVPYSTSDRVLHVYDVLGRDRGAYAPTRETPELRYDLGAEPGFSGPLFGRIGRAPATLIP